MAGPGITAGAEGSVKILDAFLNDPANGDTIINVLALTPIEAFHVGAANRPNSGTGVSGAHKGFHCRGVKVTSNVNDTAQAVAAAGVIVRKLTNDPSFLEEPYSVNIQHSQHVRYIRPRGTTARGIILYE
jgi:hypothetical protein